MTEKRQWGVVELPGLSAFVVGLKKQHFPPENRLVSEGRVLLGRLKETLLSEACLLIGLKMNSFGEEGRGKNESVSRGPRELRG